MLDKSLAKVTKNGDLPCENRHIPKAGVRKGKYTGLADGGKDPVKYGRNTVKQRRRPLLPGQGAWRGRQRGGCRPKRLDFTGNCQNDTKTAWKVQLFMGSVREWAEGGRRARAFWAMILRGFYEKTRAGRSGRRLWKKAIDTFWRILYNSHRTRPWAGWGFSGFRQTPERPRAGLRVLFQENRGKPDRTSLYFNYEKEKML